MNKNHCSFSTQLNRDEYGWNFRVDFETRDKSKFEYVQEAARKCLDDLHDESRIAYPVEVRVNPKDKINKKTKVTPVKYVCSNCERDLTDNDKRFYNHCPLCGYKIDYSNHYFLKEGLKP